jgi:hypothetical protein
MQGPTHVPVEAPLILEFCKRNSQIGNHEVNCLMVLLGASRNRVVSLLKTLKSENLLTEADGVFRLT